MTVETVDVVIVGAGPAGLAAAAELAARGGKVLVLDEAPAPGGRLPSQVHPLHGKTTGSNKKWSDGAAKADRLVKTAEQAGARIVSGVSVWGIFSGWHLALAPVDQGSVCAGLPAGVDARAVIIATGAVQNPLVMPGWTLPGVITAGAAQTLINVHHVLPGRKAAVVGLDPLSLAAARLMIEAGAIVRGIVLPPANGLQPEPSSPVMAIETLARFSDFAPGRITSLMGKVAGKLSNLAAFLYPASGVAIDGIRLFLRQSAQEIRGENRAQRVEINHLAADGRITQNGPKSWPVDVVITSAGLSPLTDLAQVAGCPLIHISDLGGWVPVHNQRLETPLKGFFVAGSITGVEGSEVAEALGKLAGINSARYLGLAALPSAEEGIRKYQADVNMARTISLPFLPEINRGREELFRHMD